MSPESQGFAVLQTAKSEMSQADTEYRAAVDRFCRELEQGSDKAISFKGKPVWHVMIHTNDAGEKIGTQVPCYSLLDDEMKPRDYEGVNIVGTTDNGQLAVRYANWGDSYEVVPISSITDFEWVEEAPSRQ